MHSSYFFTYVVLFCIIWMSILMKKKSVLSCLISLEFLHYFLFLIFYWPVPHYFNSLSLIVVLLCFAASGASLGLSILVTLSRQSGSDLIKSIV
uniref:NADH-ubiquinone oxidoreductase chain 4L n=1 Tax=Euhadra herklotsi yakushimana TaxID=244811 RepID=Q75Z39_9EUPU|nr:NADH dehydrogenase subunit 4L [Euhadra herklotsi yakushimana]